MLAVQLKDIARLSRDQRESIAGYGARTTWPAGFTVYERGMPADGIFVVLSGQVVLRMPVGAGRTFVPWVATAGETFGGEGLEPRARYASHARAEEESHTLHLGAARFSALLREQPNQALHLIRQIGAERTALIEKFGQHATLSVEQRLVTTLIRLAHSHDGDSETAPSRSPSVSRRLLGELVGATRESISLVLARLTGERLIRREGNGLLITDLAGLRQRLEATTAAALDDYADTHDAESARA